MQNYVSTNELQHWGIKGMKWGVRRFQRKDGSLTPEGKKRYDDDNDNDRDEGSTDNRSTEPSTPRTKSVSEMTDAELRERINRLSMEKQYRDLTSPNEDAEFRERLNRLNMEKQYQDLTTPNRDAELREKINHLKLEKEYRELTSKDTKKGESFIAKAVKAGTTIAAVTTTGITIYNNFAKTQNAFNTNKAPLPIIGQEKKKDKDK